MLVERTIGKSSIDVDVNKSNELYFDQDTASMLQGTGISSIINAIYKINNRTHMPLSLFMELTDSCNFSCPFCYINEAGICHSNIPRFEQLKPILDFLIKEGLIYCILTGGECTIHPDFIQIYRYLKQSGVLVTIFTNGYLLNDQMFSLFKEFEPFKIEISIYGNDDASYAKATNTSMISSNRVFNNILILKEMGINVICKTPITSLTEECYPDIERWCLEHEVPYYTGAELMDTYQGTSRSQYQASKQIRDKLEAASHREFFSSPERLKAAIGSNQQKYNFDCSGGKTDIIISSQFNLLPCIKAIPIRQWNFSINQLGIQTAYNQMVDKIQACKNRPLAYCNGCKYHEICQECFMTQYEYASHALQEHRISYCKSLTKFMTRTNEKKN